jgi:hypothetical protein
VSAPLQVENRYLDRAPKSIYSALEIDLEARMKSQLQPGGLTTDEFVTEFEALRKRAGLTWPELHRRSTGIMKFSTFCNHARYGNKRPVNARFAADLELVFSRVEGNSPAKWSRRPRCQGRRPRCRNP